MLEPFYRLAAAVLGGLAALGAWLLNELYRIPLFRSRCVAAGNRLSLNWLPDISGHPRIHVGDDVRFEGHFAVTSGRIFENPELRIGNRVVFGHNVSIIANREVIFEDDVRVGAGCRLMDSDAHPRDAEARHRKLPPPPEEIKPIRVCRGAILAPQVFIMKGVTIGEGAAVRTGSVVLSDVPAFAIVAGNPARIVPRGSAAA